ncbi:type II toxin-antitoxin system RelE/ParE family toxin [Methylobacterium oryzisoli]|uniref:type II toxin-antitoxin system RelE/ParE family toxin n=1 Tax=Methylobacterium oryzisoli TaxID=3385502 RepID=UPI00397AF0D2
MRPYALVSGIRCRVPRRVQGARCRRAEGDRCLRHGPRERGASARRPLADSLKGSKHANMKELRPTVNKVEWRVAYAFDTRRKAIVLAAAAKGGKSSALVYKQMIAKADDRFAAAEQGMRDATKTQSGTRRPKS